MTNHKQGQEKKIMREMAESLVVDNALQTRAKEKLDSALYDAEQLDSRIDDSIQKKRELLALMKKQLSQLQNQDQEIVAKIQEIKEVHQQPTIEIEQEEIVTPDIFQEWDIAVKQNQQFARAQDIDIDNPFMKMFSGVEKTQIYSDLAEQFQLARLDKFDYLFATGSGVLAGFVDAMFVGTIKGGKEATGMQKVVDNKFDKLVTKAGKQEKIAELKRNKRNAQTPEAKAKIQKRIDDLKNHNIKGYDRDNNPIKWEKKDSIRILEKNHKVSYDAAVHQEVAGMSPDNHHLRSLAHDPGPLGLVFGVYNQISGKSMFIANGGEIVSVIGENANVELSGNMIQKVVQSAHNWFFHCLSDVAGSSSSTGRGSGLPVPGWAALQNLQIGSFDLNNNQKDKNIAEVSEWMLKNGYDLRAFVAQSIPVIIYEVLVRCYWFCKQHFYFGKSVKESLPIANSRELARLLLISAASFSAIDVTHATIKSKPGTPTFLAEFIMTVNIPGLLDFGFRSVQNIRNEVEHRHHVQDLLDSDIKTEFDRVLGEAVV